MSGGFGDTDNAAIASNGLIEFGGLLIAGTFNVNGGEVWEIDLQPTQGGDPAIPTLSVFGFFVLVLLIGIAATFLLRR